MRVPLALLRGLEVRLEMVRCVVWSLYFLCAFGQGARVRAMGGVFACVAFEVLGALEADAADATVGVDVGAAVGFFAWVGLSDGAAILGVEVLADDFRVARVVVVDVGGSVVAGTAGGCGTAASGALALRGFVGGAGIPFEFDVDVVFFVGLSEVV